MKTVMDLAYGALPEQKLDIYLPEREEFDTVIWFHGGGLECGDRKTADVFAGCMTDQGVALVSVEYRMYPTAHFPDYLLDAAAATAYVREHIGEYGNSRRLFLSGQSAGAYMTMMLCLNPAFLENAGVPHAEIAGYIVDSAQQTTHFNILRERGVYRWLERIDEASPIYYISPKTQFSRLLLLYYTEDMPGREAQNQLLIDSLRRNAPHLPVEWKVLTGSHCQGSTVPRADGGFDYVDEAVRFIRETPLN